MKNWGCELSLKTVRLLLPCTRRQLQLVTSVTNCSWRLVHGNSNLFSVTIHSPSSSFAQVSETSTLLTRTTATDSQHGVNFKDSITIHFSVTAHFVYTRLCEVQWPSPFTAWPWGLRLERQALRKITVSVQRKCCLFSKALRVVYRSSYIQCTGK